MSRVRVAVVGMGIGKANGRAIARHPRGVVAALCDIAEERMHQFAKELPTPPKLYTDYREMCLDPDIDAVFVGTPNQLHVPVALEAVRNGKHVLVTKPLADSIEAARSLVEAVEASGLVGMMSLVTRFSAATQYLAQHAANGDFGELYYARGRSIRRNGIPNWNLGFIRQGGGAFRDMGVHVLDGCWWLMGRPEPVSVLGVAGAKFGPHGRGFWENKPPAPDVFQQYDTDDYAGGFIRFANGAGLQVESFWASHQAEEFQIELFGTEAGAKLDPLTIYRLTDGELIDTVLHRRRDDTAWDRLTDHFITCILDGTPCDAPLRDGLRVQMMMEALLHSGATGHEVRLGE